MAGTKLARSRHRVRIASGERPLQVRSRGHDPGSRAARVSKNEEARMHRKTRARLGAGCQKRQRARARLALISDCRLSTWRTKNLTTEGTAVHRGCFKRPVFRRVLGGSLGRNRGPWCVSFLRAEFPTFQGMYRWHIQQPGDRRRRAVPREVLFRIPDALL